jgi:hypothetical protein
MAQAALKGVRLRQPNGAPKRVPRTVEEAALIQFVAQQPHRRGEETTKAATPWQRLIHAKPEERNRIASRDYEPGQLEATGLRLVGIIDDYAKTADGRRPFAVTDGGRPPLNVDLLDKKAKELYEQRDRDMKQRYHNTMKVLQDIVPNGPRVLDSTMRMFELHPEAEERILASWLIYDTTVALIALTKHWETGRT